MTIKVNSDNLIFLNNLNSASDRLATAMARLSSGARIQNAGDDAAGFMISKGLEVSQRGLSTANNNIQMGMSLLGIAEGSIQTMLSPLYRIRDLALQSSNGVYSDTERKAMQMEVDSLFEEITRIKNTTEFNGVNLFGQQIYKDKSETFVDNETAAAISLLSYTPAPMMMSASPVNQTTEPEAISTEPEATNTESDTTTQNSEPIMMMSSAPMMRSAGANPNIIEGSVTLASGKSKTISIGDKVYTFKDGGSGLTENTCNYSYDLTTGRLTLSNTYYMTITAAAGQEDDIFVDNGGTNTYIYAGNMNDRVEITGNGNVIRAFGETGDDILIDNTTSTRSSYVSGGDGNDSIYINKNNGKATGGNGDDTFYINGDSNSVFGESNNDNFIVESGSGNFIIGGAGTNTLADNGISTGWNSINGVADYNPTSGRVYMASAQVRLKFGGKYYTVTNPDNSLIEYSYDAATDTVTFSGSYARIVADDNQVNNIILASSYMKYTGGTGGQDNITSNGSYQTINLGTGTNTVTTNAVRTSIFASGGNDAVNLNSNQNYVSLVNTGSANVTIASGKTYNIINGVNNANLTITDNGSGTGFIDCAGYTNSLPNSGTIYLKAGEEFDITLMAGTANEVSYTLKNIRTDTSGYLIYSCNATTGEITFNSSDTANRIKITAHVGQDDKIIAQGNYLHLYTGDGNDTVNSKATYYSIIDTGEGDDILTITSTSGSAGSDYPEYYAGAGNDTVTVASGVKNIDIWTGDGADTVEMNGTNSTIYTEAGADTITVNGVNNSIYAGADNDTVNLNTSNDGYVTDLGAGDDIANINANNAGSITGGDGDDNFIVATGVAGAFVDGNAGTNTLTGDTANTYRYNIEGYENRLPAKGSIAIAGSEELTIEILGQTYRILNRATTSSILKFDYNQTTGLMTFEGASLTIESATGQANNVVVNGDNMYFYGSDRNDTIVMNGENAKAYGYAGDDTITTTGGKSYAYGGDDNDTINTNGAQNYAYGEAGTDTINVNGGNAQAEGGSDNDTIVLNGILGNTSSWVKGGAGNDTITVNSANNTGYIQGNDGDDTINVNADGNTISGGAGSNTLGVGAGNITYTSSEYDKYVALKNEGEVKYDLGENFNLEIAGKIYNIEAGDQGTLNYSYNETTDEITFEGTDLRISSVMGQENNVIIKGDMVRFHGSDANDRITIESSGAIVTGGDGDDTITIKSEGAWVYGDGGNDTFNAYADATIDGGSGNNTIGLTASATNTSYSNINKIKALENSGSVTVAYNQTVDFEIAGKTYHIKKTWTGGEPLNYSYNNSTQEITFSGFDFDIVSAAGQENKVIIEGSSINYIGSDAKDIVTSQGNNNSVATNGGDDTINTLGAYMIVNAGDGNDTIISNGASDQIHGGEGNDTITMGEVDSLAYGDGGDDKITISSNDTGAMGGDGNDTITLNGTLQDAHTGIYGNSGNDTIIVNSSNNLGEILSGDDDDTVIVNGSHNSTIRTGEGNNIVTSQGDYNSILTGNGNNTITTYGNRNILATGTGADTIKAIGNLNSITGGDGSDTILIEGNENDISLDAGNDTATILGDLNTVDGGEDYDIITNGGTNTTISNCNELWKEADPFLFQVGTGVGTNSTIEVSTGFVLPILGVDISNAESARASLEDIDRVIEALTVKLGEIGVSKNRLESALSANKVAEINIAAARSNIVDADIAQESMEFLKAQILQNASASLLTASRDINSTSLLNIYNSLGNLRR